MKNNSFIHIIMDKVKAAFDIGVEIAPFPIEITLEYQYGYLDMLNEEQKVKVEEFSMILNSLTLDDLYKLDEMFEDYFEPEKREPVGGVMYVLIAVFRHTYRLEHPDE